METVVFADSWRPFFAEVGLESFNDFYDYAGGTKIGSNDKRNVYRLTLGKGPQSRMVYLKRFHHSHLKDVVTAWLNFGRLTSQALVEWDNADLLIKNGIDTYKPVCMGERKVWKFETKSFIVTEQLKTTCLIDFVKEKWRTLERSVQEKIIIAMAKLARRACESNISITDLFIWHLFIDEAALEDDCRLSIIDLHRMFRNVRSPGKKIKNLGTLYWSMSSEFFDDQHKDLLVTAYVDAGPAADKQNIMARVRKRAKTLDRRRILPNHYKKPKI